MCSFLYDFARKAAQYVCRLPMDRAYNAMPKLPRRGNKFGEPIIHPCALLVNSKIQKRLHTFTGAAFPVVSAPIHACSPTRASVRLPQCGSLAALAAWSGRLVPHPALPIAINRQRVGVTAHPTGWLTKYEFCMVACGSQTKLKHFV